MSRMFDEKTLTLAFIRAIATGSPLGLSLLLRSISQEEMLSIATAQAVWLIDGWSLEGVDPVKRIDSLLAALIEEEARGAEEVSDEADPAESEEQ